jgi:methyl-accepting chemotaxis protein
MKWSVGVKIGAGFVLAVVVMAVIGISSYSAINRLIDSDNWRKHSYEVINELTNVLSLMKDAETGQRGFVITSEDRYLEPYYKATPQIDSCIKNLQKLTVDNPAQQQRVADLKGRTAEKFNELGETIALRKEKGFENARQVILTDKGKKVMDEIRAIIGEMENEENTLLKQRSSQVDASTVSAKNVIVWGMLVAVVLSALTGFMISRNIAKPLSQLTDTAEKIAAGDLNVTLATEKRLDEVGLLTQSFSRMVKSLRDMAGVAERIAAGDLRDEIKPQSEKDQLGNSFAQMTENLRRSTTDISEAVNLLGSSASEILAAATQVASGTAETATSISETTTTVEEVRHAAQLSSQKAKAVSDNAQNVARISQSGQKAVDETAAGMLHIREQMDSIAQTTVRLSEQGQSIGGIIASVTDIADQSNLLAVNAAIEATRAGDQGKAFAVVAQEIKSLAEQSKQATAQVRAILNEVQKATSAAVMATEQGSKAVETGVKQSAQAGEAIRELAETSKEATQASSQIVASSQQQAVGMDQIAIAMENINQAGAQNAASMKQAETAARNLHELGQKLRGLVEKFKT